MKQRIIEVNDVYNTTEMNIELKHKHDFLDVSGFYVFKLETDMGTTYYSFSENTTWIYKGVVEEKDLMQKEE